MTTTRETRIASTLGQLCEMTGLTARAGRQATVRVSGTLTFEIPDLLNEGSDEPALRNQKSPAKPAVSEDQSMSDNVHFVCQSYRHRHVGTGRAKKQVLVKHSVVECKTADEARERANRMISKGACAGVDAFSLVVDEDLGDYGDPTFIARLGDVPCLEA